MLVAWDHGRLLNAFRTWVVARAGARVRSGFTISSPRSSRASQSYRGVFFCALRALRGHKARCSPSVPLVTLVLGISCLSSPATTYAQGSDTESKTSLALASPHQQSGSRAQDLPQENQTEALQIFLDCSACDFDYLRTEITYVNYVVDRKDAQVHVLVTTQQTGGGGTEYTINFIGQQEFAGRDDLQLYLSSSTDTADEVRQGFAQMLELGLLRYVAGTPLASEITILHEPRVQRPAAAQPEDDPWNFWVFRTRANASVNTEELRTGKFVFASLSANRTTEEWKINVGLNGAYADTEFELGDSDRFRNVTRNLDLTSLVVGSLGDHWAWAAGGSATASTFVNQDLTFRFAPAIQYNFFPFSESTRRQFTVSYGLGVTAFNYEEETIFGKTEEVLSDQTLTVSLDLNEPWGQSSMALEVSNFLEDFNKNRVVFFGGVSARVS